MKSYISRKFPLETRTTDQIFVFRSSEKLIRFRRSVARPAIPVLTIRRSFTSSPSNASVAFLRACWRTAYADPGSGAPIAHTFESSVDKGLALHDRGTSRHHRYGSGL